MVVRIEPDLNAEPGSLRETDPFSFIRPGHQAAVREDQDFLFRQGIFLCQSANQVGSFTAKAKVCCVAFRSINDAVRHRFSLSDGNIPTTQHILGNYPILTIEEKNGLWKLVMTKATVYRSPDGELTVNIYSNLPK